MKYLPVSILLFATTLMAQGPRAARMASGIPPLTELKSYLSLSDEQVTQLTDQKKQLNDAVSPLATQLLEKRKSLADLLKAGSTDTATIGQLRQDMAGLRRQMKDLAGQYGTNARGVLNADQQTKLQALEEAAKLMPTIRQAESLNLIEGAAPWAGMMGALNGRVGPGMMGRRRLGR